MSRKQRIYNLISNKLSADLLIVEDESNQHHVPMGAETHFNILVVCEDFHSLTKISRHRMVHALLSDEFKTGLHALSLQLHSLSEWKVNPTRMITPDCHNGFLRD